jgi:Tol biopolymer transport system component
LFIFKVLGNAKDNPPIQTIDVVNSDGTEIEAIIADGSQVFHPAWSPQSDALIYSKLSGKERHLFKISLGNLVSEQITQAGNNYSSDWFDPTTLDVSPSEELLTTMWGKIKVD